MRAYSIALGLIVAACGDDTVTLAHDARGDDATPDSPVDTPSGPRWMMEYQDLSGSVQLDSVWGSGANDIYVVGRKGAASFVLHSTGNGVWQEQTNGVSTVNGGLYTVWGSGPTDVYVGGFGDTLLHSTGNGTWTPQTIGNLGPLQIWGTGPTDVYFTYAASSGNVYHSTGNGTWSPVTIGTSASTITSVWGTSAANVYFAGGTGSSYKTPYVVHGPGSPSTETMPPLPDMYLRNIFKVWGSSANDIYAVGNTYSIYHTTGNGTWTLQTGPTGGNTFEDVWGSGPNDVYITSRNAGLYHSTGDGTWTSVTSVQNMPLAIWGSGPADIYAVGATSIMHYRP